MRPGAIRVVSGIQDEIPEKRLKGTKQPCYFLSGVNMLSKTEKRLCILAVVFVIIYLGAAALTLHGRSGEKEDAPLRFESVAPAEAEGRLAMVELLLPMLVLLTITVSFVIVRKKRARQIVALEKSEDEMEESEYQALPSVQEE